MTKYLEVLINKNIFTYQTNKSIPIGTEVLVPIRKHKASGFVIGIVPKPNFTTRKIIDVIKLKPQFSEELASLADWIASYYKCYRSKAFELILPKQKH